MTLDAANAPARAQTRQSDWRERRLRGDRGRLAAYVQRLWRPRVAASTAQRLLRRHGLAIRGQPILVLEHHRARRAGRLTKRTREAMWQLRHGRTRHVAAAQPAELVCLDTFYIAQLKMVGKVWQVTACDAAWRAGARQPRSSSVPAARLAELMHRSSGLNVSTPNQIWTA